MHCSCRRSASTQNTWQQTRYFHADFHRNGSLFLFLYFRKCLKFGKKQKNLLRKKFDLPHTNNRIYLLWNCFSNYVYPKDKYISLKGIGKILFGHFHQRKFKFPKFSYDVPCAKVNFSLIHPSHITIHSF